MQDLYAHRRIRGEYSREGHYWNWTHVFTDSAATVDDPDHTSEHDHWEDAYESCQDKTEAKTKKILKNFKSAL
jgi:hypothetical protein